MPKQFSPADRSTVLEGVRDKSWAAEAEPCGPGILVVFWAESTSTITYTNGLENYGWHVAMYDSREGGDLMLLMPITEVPE